MIAKRRYSVQPIVETTKSASQRARLPSGSGAHFLNGDRTLSGA
uniref:Uncharacterized protein n=1 Tax=Ascaris lumbricoides TaxID=6252 RepID=A0A0M3IN18_ASCLU